MNKQEAGHSGSAGAFATRTMEQVAFAIFGLPSVVPSDGILTTAKLSQREPLAALRDAYLRGLLAQVASSERIALLHRLERATCEMALIPGTSAQIVAERIDGAARKLREGTRNKADALAYWHAVDRLTADLRADRAALDALQRGKSIELRASLEAFAAELLAVSSSLRLTTAKQSASAQELASAIGQVTATLSELRETSAEALRNAESVIAQAEGALTTSASGRGSVERAIESMRVIREQVSEIAERILQLNDQTSQIGSIISTVNEISAQSKLLALNAAIEAARAGEHGKGFGVVASEIRSLAEQSKEATGQVREILSEIQASTNAAVVAAEEGTKKSESGMALADTSGERIKELARSMEESSSSARLIANSARQQSAGIDQVAQALVSISNATNDTASGLMQTERATQQLVTLAERMADIVRGVAPHDAAQGDRPANQNAAE